MNLRLIARPLIVSLTLTAAFWLGTPPSALAQTAADVIEASEDSEWRTLSPENTVYFELPSGVFIVELAPGFAPRHVANIKALVRDGYFTDGSVVRSQDNYVAQWSTRPLDKGESLPANIASTLPAEFETPFADQAVTIVPDGDVYSPEAGFVDGFPIGRDPSTGLMWMAHCYGVVGVGRNTDPASGSGASLYAVNGHAPRHLDRNLTMVGRVVLGMEHLSSLPRGTGRLGFYEENQERPRFVSVRLGSDVPPEDRAEIEVLRTDSGSFRKFIAASRSRTESFFVHPTDRIDLCNVRRPVRGATQ